MTTVSLSADASVTEGENITIMATFDESWVDGRAVTVTPSNGVTISHRWRRTSEPTTTSVR
ncbi:hypothetical protein OK016_19270 [Vibrio chagasii]|nr:hypothetical protein [Vibrio chagasii]